VVEAAIVAEETTVVDADTEAEIDAVPPAAVAEDMIVLAAWEDAELPAEETRDATALDAAVVDADIEVLEPIVLSA
jgi:hypothetical protein